ncbi:MAG: SMC family ATPase [bacterium]
MIPRKIDLKNFLSYGDEIQTIDFSKHSLICLSGKNGNGKSAMLDAMTWALWGQARKVSGAMKPDDGLLRLGQTKMMVSFEFEMGLLIYRVRREFSKTHTKAFLGLDFEIYNSELKRFVSLTEKTSRQTQAKIETVIGIDYETFVNSAFLRQGQSNEFSKKTPKERKQILANILGFSKYDKLQQIAFDKIRKFNDDKRLLIMGQEQANSELAKEPEIKANLDSTTESSLLISKKIDELNSHFQLTQEQKSKIIEQKNIYTALAQELIKIKTSEQQKLLEFQNVAIQWKQTHIKALKLPDTNILNKQRVTLIEKEKESFELRREELKHQELILQKKDIYQKRMALLESEFEKKLNELKLAVERSQFTLTQTQQTLKQKNQQTKDLQTKQDVYIKELELIKKKLKGKENFDVVFAKLKEQFEKRKAFYQTLIEKGNMIKSECSELEHKKAAVQDLNNPSCPFCEQILTVKRKQFLNTKITKSEVQAERRLNRIHTVFKKLKVVLLEQHKQIENLTKESDMHKQIELKADDLNKRIEEYTKELDNLNKEIDELTKKETAVANLLKKETEALLAQDSARLTHFAKDVELEKVAAAITEADGKIKSLKSKLDSYKQLQEQIKIIETQLKELEAIQEEIKTQPQRLMLLNITKNSLKDLRSQISITEKRLEQLKVDAQTEQKFENLLLDLKNQLTGQLKQKEVLMQQIGKLESDLQRIEKLKNDTKIRDVQIKTIETEIDDYQILANTFGKNGIQALLIEQAIPEIEAEANRILSRLTDNQAQIFIESLRDLKQGGVKETMDIQISDAAGIRPYEMYSGGEAFRFDFALRIAISKLLARRAGTALQTLVIDEGFGSQDEEGLMRVMNAIHTVQEDFLKIIIVSHLNEFKDNFPVHFIIEKTENGSVVRVEERG